MWHYGVTWYNVLKYVTLWWISFFYYIVLYEVFIILQSCWLYCLRSMVVLTSLIMQHCITWLDICYNSSFDLCLTFGLIRVILSLWDCKWLSNGPWSWVYASETYNRILKISYVLGYVFKKTTLIFNIS